MRSMRLREDLPSGRHFLRMEDFAGPLRMRLQTQRTTAPLAIGCRSPPGATLRGAKRNADTGVVFERHHHLCCEWSLDAIGAEVADVDARGHRACSVPPILLPDPPER